MIKIILATAAAVGAGVGGGLWAVGLAPVWAIPLLAVALPFGLCAVGGGVLLFAASVWMAGGSH